MFFRRNEITLRMCYFFQLAPSGAVAGKTRKTIQNMEKVKQADIKNKKVNQQKTQDHHTAKGRYILDGACGQ